MYMETVALLERERERIKIYVLGDVYEECKKAMVILVCMMLSNMEREVMATRKGDQKK